jgi:hypothetical protein
MSISLLISLCSKNQTWKELKDCDLISQFLDSFLLTVSGKYPYTFYLGYDSNDEFFKSNIEILKKRLPNNSKFFELPAEETNGNPCRAWTILYEKAYNDGHDYFYQVGSDIQHHVKGWDSYFINIMKKNDNDCIVGGVDTNFWIERTIRNQSAIIENVFTGRKHYERFGWFFPPEVKTWYSDDIITKIYRNNQKVFVCSNIKYSNSNRVGGNNENNRYKPNDTLKDNWYKIANKYSSTGFDIPLNILEKLDKYD